MKQWLLFAFFITTFAAHAQPGGRNEKLISLNDCVEIKLPFPFDMQCMEFSSLTRWGDKILFIPENDLCELRHIYAIDSTKLAARSRNLSNDDFEAYRIDSFERDEFVYGETYDGIEAAAVVGSNIYFAVETDSKFLLCYIISGTIDAKSKAIRLDFSGKLPVPRPAFVHNAGFESLVSFHGELLAIYEYNNSEKIEAVCRIDATKGLKIKEWSQLESIHFRITDIERINADTLIAINHYFKKDDEQYRREFAKENIPGGKFDPQNQCLTRLIKIYQKEGSNDFAWETASAVEAGNDAANTNWEGIVPFDGGYLLIEDGNNNPAQKSRLWCVGCKTMK